MTQTLLSKLLTDLATKRNAVFAHLERNRPLSDNYEEIGLLGEWEFGKLCGLMPKTVVGGDGGVDFELPVVLTVDVKTARNPKCLLVEAGKVKADIYVLAHYGEDGVRLVGWTSAQVVRSKEPIDTGRGVINHLVLASDLRPMAELERMMGKVRRK